MNILLTLNRNYLKYAKTLIASIHDNHPNHDINFYIISSDLSSEDFKGFPNNFVVFPFDDTLLEKAPTTSRYPKSIYYRIFASAVLDKSIDRILYLDPDIIVLKNLDELYNMDFEDNYYIATTNVKKFLTKFNEIKNKAEKGSVYANTGVMMMNIAKLRKEQDFNEIFDFINKNHQFFSLPDQDIICGLYGHKIKIVDNLIYNLSDRAINKYNLSHKNKIDLDWVKSNTKIIHYYGRNKPWKENYKGILDVFYKHYAEKTNTL